MNKKLQSLYDKAESDRKKILEIITSVPEKKLFHQPNNKWSISQILTHIILSERISLQYMRKKSLGISDLTYSGWWEEIKSALLTLSQRIPFKYKAPQIPAINAPSNLSLAEIKNQWSTVRDELKVFLTGIEDKDVGKKIYKHPLAGRLNVIHAVSFMKEHVNHHWYQIKRLL
jgi:uncharacterized damage-inducible protein DinB